MMRLALPVQQDVTLHLALPRDRRRRASASLYRTKQLQPTCTSKFTVSSSIRV